MVCEVCGRWAGKEVEGTCELHCPPYVIVYRLMDDVAEIL
jgi:hypothetical protein